MFPMVSTVDELLAARAHARRGRSGRTGGGDPAGLRVGIMVEVPAAALKTAAFAPHVDFFSIGTNDLTQYTLAAERGNAAVARSPTRSTRACCGWSTPSAGARAAGSVAVCGELAADEPAVALLTGLGVRELSVAAAPSRRSRRLCGRSIWPKRQPSRPPPWTLFPSAAAVRALLAA